MSVQLERVIRKTRERFEEANLAGNDEAYDAYLLVLNDLEEALVDSYVQQTLDVLFDLLRIPRMDFSSVFDDVFEDVALAQIRFVEESRSGS